LDRRTNTSDGSAGGSPTVVTARHGDDDGLMAETDQDTQIIPATPARAARAAVARAAAAAKEVLANGAAAVANGGSAHRDPVADEQASATDEVPALPADSIGAGRDPAGFSRSVSVPLSPGADEDWALDAHDLSSSSSSPSSAESEVTPAEVEEEPPSARTGTGWPAPDALFAGADPASDPLATPAEPTVSAASFAWDAPEPAATSSSSPARNFLRSSTGAKASTSSRTPPVTVGPAKAAPADAPSGASARPKAAKRSARQAHLTVARVEPWSVMKFSFAVSLVAFVILFVAVSVIYGTLSALGVFTSLQHVVQSVTSSQNSNGVNAAKWFTASRVLGYTALLGALNIVLITAMSTIGAVIYNLTSRLIGGVEVTLRETE
jgi:hypothetical protein